MQLDSTIFIVLIPLLSFTPAFVLPDHLSLRHKNETQLSLSQRSELINTDSHDRISNVNLIKRDWRNEHRNIFTMVQRYGEGWTAHFNLLDMVNSNVDVAAHQLEQFYRAVLSAVENYRTSRPAQFSWGASYGGLTLAFRSHRPIPWDWIRQYLIDVVRKILGLDARFMLSTVQIRKLTTRVDQPNARIW